VELLVIIGVIAILASVIVPVLWSARSNAVTAMCMSNLRQIGHALELYLGDNSNRYPPDPGFEPPEGRLFWYQTLLPYTESADIFHCKARRDEEPKVAADLVTPYHADYSYNLLLSGESPSDGSSATRVAVVDGNSNISYYLNDLSSGYHIIPRHGNGWNVLYVDGHVRKRASGDPSPDHGYHWEANPPKR